MAHIRKSSRSRLNQNTKPVEAGPTISRFFSALSHVARSPESTRRPVRPQTKGKPQ